MDATVLRVDHHDDGVVVATLNRPDKRNALSAELRQSIVDTLESLAANDAVNAVVMTGAGSTFCAGFDLDEVLAAPNPHEVFAHATTYHHAVHTFPKPLIAAVEGAAVAGGMDLALLCDLRVCATDARFGQPQVKMGVPAAYDLLATIIAPPAARQLCLTGQVIGVADATNLGLVHQVVDPGTALARAIDLASEISGVAGAVAMKQAIVASQPRLFFPGDSGIT